MWDRTEHCTPVLFSKAPQAKQSCLGSGRAMREAKRLHLYSSSCCSFKASSWVYTSSQSALLTLSSCVANGDSSNFCQPLVGAERMFLVVKE